MAAGYRPYISLIATIVAILGGWYDPTLAESENLLLVADAGVWRGLSIVDLNTLQTHTLPVSDVANPVAVDYDPVDRAIYWTDVVDRVIRRATFDGSMDDVILTFNDSCTTDGMALDTLHRRLYYTDFSRKLIGRANLDGSDHEVALKLDEGDAPRDIVLDMFNREMYWTDWGNSSRIEKASFDGGNRKVVVNILGGWPNALAVDFSAGVIYWCDAKLDRIERADIDGRNRRILLAQNNNHFFGITLDHNFLYVTDWAFPHVRRFERNTMRETQVGTAFVYGRLNGVELYSTDFPNNRLSCGDVTCSPETTPEPPYSLIEVSDTTTETTSADVSTACDGPDCEYTTTDSSHPTTTITGDPPVLQGVSPLYGPVSGGTAMTITGLDLATRQLKSVTIGKHACSITYWNDTQIHVESPRGHVKLIGVVLAINVTYKGGLTLTLDETFLYWYDPEIDSIQPLTTILEGGITQTVIGRHLDSVAHPVMEVTMVHTAGTADGTADGTAGSTADGTPSPGSSQAETVSRVFSSEDCDVDSEESMHCITPHMDLTPEEVTLLQREPEHLESPDPRGKLDFFVGFRLDGVSKYRNLTNLPELREYSQLNVSPVNPVIDNNGLIVFKHRETIIHLRGKNLDQGARHADYHVTVGNVTCEVQRLTGSVLTCTPPTLDDPYDQDHDIVVRIGHYLSYFAGNLRYQSDLDLWIIIGCATASAILCFIMVIVVVCVVRRRRKKAKKCDSPSYNDIHVNGAAGNGTLSMRPNDHYSIQLRPVHDMFPSPATYAIGAPSHPVPTNTRHTPNGVLNEPGGTGSRLPSRPANGTPCLLREEFIPPNNGEEDSISSDDGSDDFSPVYENYKTDSPRGHEDNHSIYENVF